MEQFAEFIINHWLLASSFAVLLGLLIKTEMSRAGASVGTQDAINLINNNEGQVLDIREVKEFHKGHITDALNIPVGALKERVVELEKFKTKPVIVACENGQSASFAGRLLKESGFEHVVRLSGGVSGWRNENLPLIKS